MPTVVNISEAAVLAAVSPRTLRRRIVAGELQAVVSERDRRQRLIRVDDIRAMIEEVPLRNAG